MIGTTMMARQMIMTFMDFFRGFIGMGLDEEMLVCLSTMQSYCNYPSLQEVLITYSMIKPYCTKQLVGGGGKIIKPTTP
jgi:hypothetical protein